MKYRIYLENLNGLRFLCFISVFMFHIFRIVSDSFEVNPVFYFFKNDIFGNGNLGVNFFFVLSGFLITFLLIEEKILNKQISIPKFWLRRVLRIWPLFFLIVFFGFAIYPYIKNILGQSTNEKADVFYYFLFLNNFDFLNKGFPYSSILAALWSVAVEEQFYLVWPIIIYLFPLKNLWIPFSIIICINLLFRNFNNNSLALEIHTLSCIGDLTIGAFGAWLINFSRRFKSHIEFLSLYKIIILYISFFLAYFFKDEFLETFQIFKVFERLILAILILAIILEQTFSKNSFFKMNKFKTISNMGILSYGLYCFHFIGIYIVYSISKKLFIQINFLQLFFFIIPISFGATYLLSYISYKYFETPFLKLKEKYSFFRP